LARWLAKSRHGACLINRWESGVPSYRVSETMLSLSRFEVVGQDGAETEFIGHAGLVEATGSHHTASVPVLDMGPPLHGHDKVGQVRGDVVGSAALTDDEVQKIKTFVDRHANEHAVFSQFSTSQRMRAVPQMYCVHPHVAPLCEDDGRYVRMRFSCAGFVLESYKTARIRLLDLNALPMVDMAIIAAAYPQQTQMIEREMIAAKDLGLDGDGPWPVLLCGYLFHALNRAADVIRQSMYAPDIMDRYFR
jgi:hypothetical protein